MARWQKDGTRRATDLFEAAAWYQAVRPVCQCGHSAPFDPYGLWWLFERKGWIADLWSARERFWCSRCRVRTGKLVRPVRLDVVKPGPDDIKLPMPDERVWKRAISRFRA